MNLANALVGAGQMNQATECAPKTLREIIHEREQEHHAALGRLETARTKMPAIWLEMTPEQVHAAFGVNIHVW